MTDQVATDELDDNHAAPDPAQPHTDSDEIGTAEGDTVVLGERSDLLTPDAAPVASPVAVSATEPARRSWFRRRRPKRISRWDRPPDPHDWRFFVGNLGKVLIAAGLMMFGFVAYQLWGTGIETARAQNALENEFWEIVAENQANRPDAATGPDAAGPAQGDTATPEVADAAPVSSIPDADGASTPSSVPAQQSEGSGDPAQPPAPLVPVEQDIPPIFRGQPLALLEIPAIGRSDYVVPGVSLNDLKDGPGHYPDSVLPGQLGNATIAGHRTTYGAPFFNVDDLKPGDELIVTMLTGDQFTYEVTFIEVVTAADYWVVTRSDPNVPELTLTSCHPKYTARDRIVVHSVLNPAKSATVGFATPYDLEGDDEGDDEQAAIPGDDPVLADPAVTTDIADATATPATSVTEEGDAGEPVADPEPATEQDGTEEVDQPGVGSTTPTTAPQSVTDSDVGDAFSQGWFEDRDAFPQIVLWATALTLISLAAYAISRRFRHYSIGFLFGVAPFLFCLYFFYQNVNRLLPPGL